MPSQSKTLKKKLQVSEESFRLLVSVVRDYAIYMLTPEGLVATWNEGAERIKGYAADEIIGRHFSVFYTEEGLARKLPELELETARREGYFKDEDWRVRKDGSLFWASVTVTPVRDDAGQVVGFAKVTRDLTERKAAEDALRESETRNREMVRALEARTVQLEAIIRELETFSYSVSHDLRSPLRTMDGYSQALLEDYGDQLDEEGRHYLERIRAGSQRMADLIDDLLNLSHVSRVKVQETKVNLSTLAHEVAAELRESEPERTTRFEIESDVSTLGDGRLLRVLLVNLLGNAWKFTRDQASGLIEFGRVPWRSDVFFVRDNGVGFDMTFADKLFQPFHRLHGAEYPGSGIGLATVQRVITRHSGRIWAESKPGGGATFYFELPGMGKIPPSQAV